MLSHSLIIDSNSERRLSSTETLHVNNRLRISSSYMLPYSLGVFEANENVAVGRCQHYLIRVVDVIPQYYLTLGDGTLNISNSSLIQLIEQRKEKMAVLLNDSEKSPAEGTKKRRRKYCYDMDMYSSDVTLGQVG